MTSEQAFRSASLTATEIAERLVAFAAEIEALDLDVRFDIQVTITKRPS